MANSQLIEMARHNMEHVKAGTLDLADGVYEVPAANYYSRERFDLEVEKVFKRLPIVLAPSAELPSPGDYKAMNVVGVPILLTRGADGKVRAFLNSCTHRGTNVVLEGTGAATRFVCGYHGWTFDRHGKLLAVSSAHEFGDIDKSRHGLTELRAIERAGLIWGILDAGSSLDFDAFIAGYDELIGEFDFAGWHLFRTRTLRGPNWKIAYDGYLDFYHVPVLHKDSFGTYMSNRALYYAWGPHQRVVRPSPEIARLEDLPEDEWDNRTLLTGVWTIFPNISIASFQAGERTLTFQGGGHSLLVTQLFPGEQPGESVTTQYLLMDRKPTDEEAVQADRQFEFLRHIVEDEDYATGFRQQKALEGGGHDCVQFGRNEGGGQRFHGWIARVIDAGNDELNGLFSSTRAAKAAE